MVEVAAKSPRADRLVELVVIDGAVPDLQAVRHAAARRRAGALVLEPGRDGLEQIVDRLAGYRGFSALHIVGHGRDGAITLAGAEVDAISAERSAGLLARIGAVLTPDGSLLLYGCGVAAGERGRAFVARLAALTGVAVAAAAGPVGAASLGGSWALAHRHGRVTAAPLAVPAMAGLLATITVTNTNDSGAGSLREALGTAAGNGVNDVIEFALGVTGTISLQSRLEFIGGAGGNDTTTITGPGSGSLTIAAGVTNLTSLLYLSTPGIGEFANVSISGLTFSNANGTDESEGVIRGGADLTLTNVVISSYVSSAVSGLGDLTVVGSTFSTTSAASAITMGTAFTSAQPVSLTNVTFSNPNGSYNVSAGGQVTVDNVTFGATTGASLTGAMSLVKNGADTLVLSGLHSHSGGTTVSAGVLSVSADQSLGSGAVTLNGGTLAVTGATTIDNAMAIGASHGTVAVSADITISGAVSGSGTLTKTGANLLTLSGTNTHSGATVVSAGTLKLSGGSALSDSAGVTVSAGATLDINGTTETIGTLSGDGNVSLGSGTLTVAQSTNTTFSGVVSGSGGLNKTGTGTLTLSGANSLTGTVTVSAGTLTLAGGSAIADGATVHVAAGATLDLNGTTETIGSLTGSGIITTGAGTLTLSNPGASSFAGTLSGTGPFKVAAGVTLKGTGTYTTPIEVLSGATIAPGNSPGIISTGDLTLASGSTATMEIDGTTAGTQHDQIAVTGTVTINSATLTTVFGYTSTIGNSYVLISNDGVDAVTGTFSGLAEGASFTSGTRTYAISYAGDDGNDVTLTDTGAAPASSSGSDGGGSGTALHLVGNAADETFLGSDGADTISAMAGNDQIYAGAGGDLAYGNQGSDTLWGEADTDTLYGGQDADVVYGNQGSDLLYGNLGTDALYGGRDADTVYGGQGGDLLYGNLGNDVLHGNRGADTLYGGQGDDTLSGGAGNDLLVGGLGADRYAFGTGDGADSVSGFSSSEGDVIAIAANVNGTGIASVADLPARLSTDSHGDAVLDLGAGNTVSLLGVRAADASADWFVLT